MLPGLLTGTVGAHLVQSLDAQLLPAGPRKLSLLTSNKRIFQSAF
jgi:hypothetical protein